MIAEPGVLLTEVKEHVIQRTTDIQANYTKMSPAQFKKIPEKINADPDKGKSRAHRAYELARALLELPRKK